MATTYLSRTNTTGTSTQKGTISAWIKGSEEPSGNNQTILASWGDANNHGALLWNGSDKIDAFDYQSGYASQLQTNAVLRDSSAWYHIVYSWDTTLATADDRQKIYINGVEQTYSTRTNYSQNAATSWNANSYSKRVGALNSSSYFSGLISYTAFVDGLQYDATSFGETNAATGIWKINTSPSVTYGTNGFFLKMDTSSPGSDTSGNNNTFTASGTPTLAQDNASNNLATMNPLDNYYQGSIFSNGNNTFLTTDVSTTYNTSSIMVNTGKWYVECKVVSGSATTNIGIVGEMADATTGEIKAKEFGYAYISNGEFGNNGSASSYGSSYANGDIIGIALDCTNNKLYFSKNGTFQDSGNPSAGSGGKTITAVASTTLGLYTFAACDTSNGDVRTFSFNFGNGFFGTTAIASSNADAAGHGLFEYAVPTGYYTLNTKNLNTYGG